MLNSIPRMGNLLLSQKTKGLSFSEEKYTIRSRPERNISVFRGKWLLRTVLTRAHISVKSKRDKIKDCRLTIKCLSGEKTKLSVNCILLSKSSQQHLALNWGPSESQRCASASSCSCSWSRQCRQWSTTAPKLPVSWWSSVQ